MFISIAQQTVHTTGINWESVAVIATSVLAIVGAFVTWIGNKITHAINDLSTVLQAKLETKENVNGLNVRLTRLETTVRDKWQSP